MIAQKAIKKHWLLLLIIFLIAGWFYWFQWRPARIRGDCNEYVVERLKEETEKRSTKEWQERYDLYFENCLHSKGLR